MPKNAMGPINSSKNKLNSEIIFIFHLNSNAHYVSVWIQLIVASAFLSCGFLFFFFFWFNPHLLTFPQWTVHIRALFTDPQIPLFSNFFIKNGSYGTIYTFKNYFAIAFSISVFNFSKNKLNPNGPYVLLVQVRVCDRNFPFIFLDSK